MNIEHIRDFVEGKDGLSEILGIKYVSTAEPEVSVARMKVGLHNCQPWGMLGGGASMALAENVAGVGSMALCPGMMGVGINVSGSHVKPAKNGDIVTATARLQHRGRTLHVWHVDITNQEGDLISTVQVTNYMMRSLDR